MNSLISSALSLSFSLSFRLSKTLAAWLQSGLEEGIDQEWGNCQGVTAGKSSGGELALSPGLAVWMVLHIKGNKGKTESSKNKRETEEKMGTLTPLVKGKFIQKWQFMYSAEKSLLN